MSGTRTVSDFAAAIGIVGTVSSQIMNLSAVPSIYKIYKSRSTLLYPPYPFVFGMTAAVLGVTYAAITKQYIALTSSSIALAVNSFYLSVHFRYTKIQKRLAKITAACLAVVVFLAGIGPAIACGVQKDDDDACENFSTIWLGVVMTVIYSLLYCGQLTTFKQVIKMKNSASISPWLTGGTLFCASAWTWYSILVKDYFYLTSSAIGVASGLTQIILILVYPAKWDFTDNQTNVERNEIVIVDESEQQAVRNDPQHNQRRRSDESSVK